MIDSEFERKGREMSDEIFSVITLQDLAEYFGKVNTEYKWLQEQPTHSDETDKLREELEARSVCAQVVTCNGAAILKLQAELEAANKRAKEDEQALLDYAILRVSLTERTAKAEAERAQLRAELEQVKAERDAMGAVVASQSRNACVSGGTPTLAERALERARNQLRAELETAQDNALRAANLGAEWKERAERYKSERDAAILDARKLAQNWNGVMTSVELEAIVKKYLQQ